MSADAIESCPTCRVWALKVWYEHDFPVDRHFLRVSHNYQCTNCGWRGDASGDVYVETTREADPPDEWRKRGLTLAEADAALRTYTGGRFASGESS